MQLASSNGVSRTQVALLAQSSGRAGWGQAAPMVNLNTASMVRKDDQDRLLDRLGESASYS